jgi:hypothetical protein
MWWVRTPSRPQLEDALLEDLSRQASMLENNALKAGCALACSYSSSQEYEAALIAERRAAGAYRTKRNPWLGRIAAIGAGALLLIVGIVLFTR